MSRFRPQYRELMPKEKQAIEGIKEGAELIAALIAKFPNSREGSLAVTKLEEAVMWAVKGITA